MFSEALRISGRNTLKYMVRKTQRELDEKNALLKIAALKQQQTAATD